MTTGPTRGHDMRARLDAYAGDPIALHAFGGLRMMRAGAHFTGLGSRMAEALLVYLAMHDAPLTRDHVAELLWPDGAAGAAKTSLRSCLHLVTRMLGPVVHATRSTVAAGPGLALEVREFERLVAAGRLVEARELYRGPFLDGFYLPGRSAFEDWVELEAERLREMALGASRSLLANAYASGSLDDAIRWARSVLELDPLHEPTHRMLMRSLAERGDRTAALAQFERCRNDLLAFGFEPGREIVELGLALRSGADTTGSGLAPLATPSAPIREHTLPFIGRQDELQALEGLLSAPDCRLVVVTGPGGVGKSRIVSELVHRIAARFAHGAAEVPLAGVPDAAFVWSALARNLVPGPAVHGAAEDDVRNYLRDKQLLLVLDNFEHLLTAAPMVVGLLDAAPGLKVVVTSRERLRLREEWVVRLQGLGDPSAVLFELCAVRADPAFDAGRQREGIQRICDTVAGSPLAIAMAASWTGVMSCDAIATELRRDGRFLNATWRDAYDRHSSIEALFDGSWTLLTPELQDRLMRLSVFRGGFTRHEAASVAEASVRDLVALTDASLLVRSGDDRFDLHELIRQQAAHRLAGADLTEATSDAHFLAYADLAEEAHARFFESDQLEAHERIMVEMDNVRAALEWSLARPSLSDRLGTMLDALGWTWRFAHAMEEGSAWLRRSLETADLTAEHRVLAKYHLGHLHWMRSDYPAAHRHLTEALAQALELGPAWRRGAALAQLGLGNTLSSQGDLAGALDSVDNALELLTEPGEEGVAALVQGLRAWILRASGDLQGAQHAVSECLATLRARGCRWALGLNLGIAAQIAFADGDLAAAGRYAEEGRSMLQSVGFVPALGYAYIVSAHIASAGGDIDTAREHLDSALACCLEMGNDTQADEVRRLIDSLASSSTSHAGPH